jgi:hypothetical protein
MTRRTVLICCVIAAASQLSSGCWYYRPFLWRWGCCGGCAPCGGPAYGPVSGGPALAAPAVGGGGCSSCFASPGAAAPLPAYPVDGAAPVFTGAPTSITPLPQVYKSGPVPSQMPTNPVK